MKDVTAIRWAIQQLEICFAILKDTEGVDNPALVRIESAIEGLKDLVK